MGIPFPITLQAVESAPNLGDLEGQCWVHGQSQAGAHPIPFGLQSSSCSSTQPQFLCEICM